MWFVAHAKKYTKEEVIGLCQYEYDWRFSGDLNSLTGRYSRSLCCLQNGGRAPRMARRLLYVC